MHSRERLVVSAALIGVALGSFGLLSACAPKEKPIADPAASAAAAPPAGSNRLDPNDPAALRQAAEIIGAWQAKDPETTAKVLKDQGVLISDPAAIRAMAAASATASPSASPTAVPGLVARPGVPPKPPSSPLA